MTLLFIIFTCPSAISSQYYGFLLSSYIGNVILFSADCIAFSYHSLTILILCLSNKQFLRKIRQTFNTVNRSGIQPTHTTSNTANKITQF